MLLSLLGLSLALAEEPAAPSPDADTPTWALGVDYAPPSLRADLAWTEAEQLSGTLVGENDGLLRTPLSLYGGRFVGQNAWLGGLSYARLARVDWSGDGRVKSSASGVRVAADWQRYLRPRELMRPTLWVGGGLYGVIPIAENRSNTDTLSEREDRGEENAAVRARVGGYGGRAGIGAEIELVEGLSLGFRSHVQLYRAAVVQEDSLVSSSLWTTETALRLQFEF
ncbi:MAG: hypothetical protein H6741_05340 [Alphaproteobacteria bacterium]|nr:hypothetical protein [Alphaproteobacteria bacterium]MCB9792130.1 hypothetical protein [Alphaproteobacteria bacterium]